MVQLDQNRKMGEYGAFLYIYFPVPGKAKYFLKGCFSPEAVV